jgi:hypothetical protein
MANDFYNHGSFPTTGSAATSASMRAELDSIAAGFDKMPTLTASANAIIVVNSTATALTSIASLPATAGGTGQTSYAIGDLLYASTTTALSKLADVATGNALISGGVSVAPSWGKIGLTTHVSGTLPVANGGTGITSFGTGVATALGVNVGTAGAFVVNGGALGTPSSGTVTNLTGTASININGTVGATTANTGAFTSITSTSASGILTRAAATQDGVELIGRAGGTTSLKVTLTPTTLTASRTITFPDANINFATGLPVANGGTGLTSGTSGGVLYYSATGTLASSAALAASAIVLGGGAGAAPATTTTGTGVITALGVSVGTAGAFVVNGGALGTPSSGTVTNLTGTASININGTVGATTPAAGTFTSLSDSGNLTFTGTGNRITGDFSNATFANRVAFQTSTANSATTVYAIPSGSSTTSGFIASTDPAVTNGSEVRVVVTGTAATLTSSFRGSGTTLPLTFDVGGERMRLDTVGNVLIGGTAVRGTTVGAAHLDIFNGTAPAGTLSNGISLYSASGDFNFMDATGNGYKVGFRNVPAVGTKTASYTLATADVGKYVQVGAAGAIVIPDATFAEGDIVSVFNNNAASITITCTITTAYISGTDADKATVTLATRGVATIFFISGTVCVITGNVT